MLSGKKLLLLGFIVVLLIVIPLTVYLVQQQQKLKVGATPATVISFSQPSVSVAAGQTFSEDVMVNPGTNQVSFIKLKITYDSTKIATAGAGIVPNSSIFTGPALQGPIYTPTSTEITLSVGSNPQNAISSQQKVATITFKALDTTTTPTSIAFAPDPATQVLSIGTADQFNENVLVSSQPASVTITGSLVSPSSSPAASLNKIPVCTALSIDKAASGTVPYTINFTAIGNDPDGTITKATFNWGDGSTQDVTDTTTAGGGIGTASVNTQLVHIYNNAGTYTAKATLTDNNGGVSNGTSCTQTITIAAATGGATGGTTTGGGTSTTQTVTVPTATPAATPIVIATPIPVITPTPTLAATGPGDKFISVGVLGVISTIVGAIILFAL